MIVANSDFHEEGVLYPLEINEESIKILRIEIDCDGGWEKIIATVLISEKLEVYELPYSFEIIPSGSFQTAFTSIKNRVRELLLLSPDFTNKTII